MTSSPLLMTISKAGWQREFGDFDPGRHPFFSASRTRGIGPPAGECRAIAKIMSTRI